MWQRLPLNPTSNKGGSWIPVRTWLNIHPSNEVKSKKGAGDTEINEVARM